MSKQKEQPSEEQVYDYYMQTYGTTVPKLIRCFLTELLKNAKLSPINKSVYYFYYEQFDFELNLKENDMELKVFDMEKMKPQILYFRYYHQQRCYDQGYSRVYFDFDSKSHFYKIEDLHVYHFLPILFRDLSRAMHPSIVISKETILTYLQEEMDAIPKKNYLLAKNIIPDGFSLNENILMLIENIHSEANRDVSFSSSIAKAEHQHTMTRLLQQELPNLISSYCDLSEENRTVKQDELEEQLHQILMFLLEKKKSEETIAFDRSVTLVKERYVE